MGAQVPRRSGRSRRGRVDEHALGRHVRAFSAAEHEYTHSEGKVVGYWPQPTVEIERADGTRFSWMAHLCELIDPPVEPAPPSMERVADVLAQALIRVGAYPLNYPRTADGIKEWARAHAAAGTPLDIDTEETAG